MRKEKFKKLNLLMKINKLDGYIIPKNDSFFTEQVKYDRLKLISGFSGSAGIAVILKKENYLFVDNRYSIQAKIESGNKFKILNIIYVSKPIKKNLLNLFSNFALKASSISVILNIEEFHIFIQFNPSSVV